MEENNTETVVAAGETSEPETPAVVEKIVHPVNCVCRECVHGIQATPAYRAAVVGPPSRTEGHPANCICIDCCNHALATAHARV